MEGATIRGSREAESDTSKVVLQLGTHRDRWNGPGRDEYRGVDVGLSFEGSSFSSPGTHVLGFTGAHKPMWSATMFVNSRVVAGEGRFGHVVIDELVNRSGSTPPHVRGGVQICFDSWESYPGPLWVAGTFDAEVVPSDAGQSTAEGMYFESGRIIIGTRAGT